MKAQKFKVALVFGTRPEIIKLSSLVRCFLRSRISFLMIHTGQHYSYQLDKVFFKELNLPSPQYFLRIRSRAPLFQGDHTARMLMGIEKILLKERPSHVLVQGDTNSVLAGSLASSKISTTRSYTGFKFTLGHVEAGLRSYDREMPEEINRVVSDHLSDLLFAPTFSAQVNLLREGISRDKIYITGNTIVDALVQNLEIARQKVNFEKSFGSRAKEYVLATLHRQENVDEPHRFREILKGIQGVAEKLKSRVLFPMHPRTQVKVKQFGVRIPSRIQIMEPVGFLEFLILESNASLILSDSGGVQEEACILRVPCVTLRTTTERPETLKIGANDLAGVSRLGILRSSQKMIQSPRRWKNPYGDGKTGERILEILKRHQA